VIKQKLLVLVMVALFGGVASAADIVPLLQQASEAWAANDLPLAESRFREAAQQQPDSSAAYAGLAKVLMLQNRNDDAIEAYQSAIMVSPEDAKLFLGIAVAFLHGGEYGAANAMVAQALVLDPELKGAQNLALYIDRKQAQLAEAEKQGQLPAGHPAPDADAAAE